MRTLPDFFFKPPQYIKKFTETEELCFSSSDPETTSENPRNCCDENFTREFSDWESTFRENSQSRQNFNTNNDGLGPRNDGFDSINDGFLDLRMKGVRQPSRGSIITRYLSTPS